MLVNHKFTGIPVISLVRQGILDILTKGPIDGVNLLEQVNIKLSVSKQGLYKALRELMRDEVIIKEKKLFTLNKVWLSRLKDFVEESEQNLGVALPFLEESFTGRKVIVFKDMDALNIYWGHLFLALSERFNDKPFFFFNHHSWFIHDSPHSEMYLYKKSLKKKNKVLITLGANTLFAKDFKTRFAKANIQISINEKIGVPMTDNLCVIGDYIITTRYDKNTMTEIDTLFKNSSSFGENEKNEFKKMLSFSKRPKMIITKNKRKATIWKHSLAKNFVIKKTEL
ncbi:hypothetical protein IPF86_00535 [Candidatus Nomurabacteria bacterium]|jgi:hypothetical protein|nr:MAG: hypothetical protein IPF86_00535 [Candidatus Nomurabacteria bacterium]